MLSTALPGCDDGPFHRVFKTLLPFDKEEKNKVYLLHLFNYMPHFPGESPKL